MRRGPFPSEAQIIAGLVIFAIFGLVQGIRWLFGW
jgi:hypothetical protein